MMTRLKSYWPWLMLLTAIPWLIAATGVTIIPGVSSGGSATPGAPIGSLQYDGAGSVLTGATNVLYKGSGLVLTNNGVIRNHFLSANAYGDSITYGSGASASNNCYVALLASYLGINLTNNGISGTLAIDNADVIFTNAVSTNSLATYLIGANDQVQWSTAPALSAFQNIHQAQAAYLAIPDSWKVYGSNTVTITYAGAWSASTNYGGIGRSSTSSSATATVAVFGGTIVVGYTAWKPATTSGKFTVTVDGVLQGTFNSYFDFDVTSPYGAGRTYGPCIAIIRGLAIGNHTVVIQPTVNGQRTDFDWIAAVSYTHLTLPTNREV